LGGGLIGRWGGWVELRRGSRLRMGRKEGWREGSWKGGIKECDMGTGKGQNGRMNELIMIVIHCT